MVIKAKNTITLVRTDDGLPAYVHNAWAWSADGTDRFTTAYPGENLITESLSGKFPKIENSNQVSANTFTELNEEGTLVFGVNPGATNTPYYFVGAFGSSSNILGESYLSKVRGKHVVASANVEVDKGDATITINQFALSIYSWGADGTVSQPNVRKTKFEEELISVDAQLPDDLSNILVAVRCFAYGGMTFDGAKILVNSMKLEIVDDDDASPTPYTPAPSEDPSNAYPHYMGTCSNHSETAPTDPSEYEWARILGATGGEGKPGENGKEVISGYLSNESLVLPANASGVVSDFSKATGKFVVYEGQTQKTSGVTYAVTSQVGITTTIDASGTYKVTALSADLGTAIFKATYGGVSIEKILIATKAKQGPNGATGATGATGPQGPPTGITESTTVPSSPYIGMLWKHTGSVSGYIKNATYRWDGSKWSLYIFTAENISASTLSAICANLGTVTAGTINGVNINGSIIKNTFKNWETGIEFGSAGSGLYLGGTTTIQDGRVEIESKLHNKSGVQISPLKMFKSSLSDEGIKCGTYDNSGAKNLIQLMAGELSVVDLTGSEPRYAFLNVDDIIKLKNFNEKTRVIFDAGNYGAMEYPTASNKHALGDTSKIRWIIINWAMYDPSAGTFSGLNQQSVIEYSSTSALGFYDFVLPYSSGNVNTAAEMTIKRIRFPYENNVTYLQGDDINKGNYSKWWLMRKLIVVEG